MLCKRVSSLGPTTLPPYPHQPVYKQQPRRGRPPGRPVLHPQTIILSFRANLWFAKNLITTQPVSICDSSLSLRNDIALLCVYIRPFINNKSVTAHIRAERLRRRAPCPFYCHDVILRALPEESLLYNNDEIIILKMLLHQRSFALLRMTILCFVLYFNLRRGRVSRPGKTLLTALRVNRYDVGIVPYKDLKYPLFPFISPHFLPKIRIFSP